MKSFLQKIDNSTCKWSWAIDLMEEITKLTIVSNITSSNPMWKPKCWPYGQRPHHLWCSFWCLQISQKSSWSKVSKSSCNISNQKGIFYDRNSSSPIERAKFIFVLVGNQLLALFMLYCQDITSKLPKSMGLIQCPLPFLFLKVMVLRHIAIAPKLDLAIMQQDMGTKQEACIHWSSRESTTMKFAFHAIDKPCKNYVKGHNVIFISSNNLIRLNISNLKYWL